MIEPMHWPTRYAAFLLTLLLAAGCKSSEPAAEIVVEQAREVGALPQAASIRGRDGGYSGRFVGRSVWL